MFNVLKLYFVSNLVFKKKSKNYLLINYFKYISESVTNMAINKDQNLYKVTYRFNLNFNFYYTFKFNNNPGYSFSKNYKTKKYKKNDIYLKNDKNDLLLSLKFIYFIFNKVSKNDQKKMIIFYFKYINFFFFSNISYIILFIYLYFKKDKKIFFFNLLNFYRKIYIKKHPSLKKPKKKKLLTLIKILKYNNNIKI